MTAVWTEDCERMPRLALTALDGEQQSEVAALMAGPRGGVTGPFIPLLRSPGLLRALRQVGDHLRFESVVCPRLREFAILLVARAWSNRFEWYTHASLALAAGLDAAIIEAVAEGRRPEGLASDEDVVHDFYQQLSRTRGVSDASYARTIDVLGEAGVVDLLGLLGYFTTVCMIMNVAKTPPPATEGIPPLRPFPL